MLGSYSKVIAALIGNAIAILLVWLASKGIATCTLDAGGGETCVIFGFSQAQLTAAAMALFNTIFVYIFPANRPPA